MCNLEALGALGCSWGGLGGSRGSLGRPWEGQGVNLESVWDHCWVILECQKSIHVRGTFIHEHFDTFGVNLGSRVDHKTESFLSLNTV